MFQNFWALVTYRVTGAAAVRKRSGASFRGPVAAAERQPGVLVVTYRVEHLPESDNPFEDVWVMERYGTGVWSAVEPDRNGEARVTM